MILSRSERGRPARVRARGPRSQVLPLTALSFQAARHLPLPQATAFGIGLTLIASGLCLRGVLQRVGSQHRYLQAARRLPGSRFLFGAAVPAGTPAA